MLFDLIEESKKLISLRSDGLVGTRPLAEHLAPFCKQLGFNVTIQQGGNGGGNEVNLIAHNTPGPDLCPGGLTFVTHLDTVPGGDPSLWTKTGGDPYHATVEGDCLYGLGSADTKLDILCKLLAVEKVGLKNIKTPFALIGTFGEERSLAGTRLLKETGLIHPKLALIGEPSELRPVIAHKGILYLKAYFNSPHPPLNLRGGERGSYKGERRSFTGRAAHGSTPHLGENAILKAIDWLLEEQKKRSSLQLLTIQGGTVHNVVPAFCALEVAEGKGDCPRIGFLKKFLQVMKTADAYLATHENKAFDPSRTTSNVGVIRGDEKGIEIEFDFRLIPETDGNALAEILQTVSREVEGAQVTPIRSNPPMNTEKSSEIADRVGKALQAVDLPISFKFKSGNTEGAIFNMMGAEAIVIGPGRSEGNIHSPNEHTTIPQLQKAVEFYTAFLGQFC